MPNDLVAYFLNPFPWIWAFLIVGFVMALSKNVSDKLTMRKNRDAHAIIFVALMVTILGGLIKPPAIEPVGLGMLLRYIFHPYTVGWTLFIIGVVIWLPDERVNPYLDQDRIGIYVVIACLISLAILSLNIISFQLVIGLVIGAAGGFFARPYIRHNEPVTEQRTLRPVPEGFIPQPVQSRFNVPVFGDDDDDEDLQIDATGNPDGADEDVDGIIPHDEPQ